MDQLPFKDYLYEKFLEWEKLQGKRRASISAYARWLSDNTSRTEIKQQTLNTWMNGVLPTDYKYVLVLAEKVGSEIYEILNIPRPNPYLQTLNRVWEFIPENIQKKFSEEAEEYETKNINKRVQKVSKRRPPRKVE